MSEKSPKYESELSPEKLHEKYEVERHHESSEAAPAPGESSKQHIEELRTEVEKNAPKSESIKVGNESKPRVSESPRILKKEAYVQILARTRAHLSKPSKAFSKVVHNDKIDGLSNVTAATVARPSGLLGGGLGALLGTSTLLYFSRHYGFRYNFALFLLLFVAGFAIGLIIELLVRLILPKRSKE